MTIYQMDCILRDRAVNEPMLRRILEAHEGQWTTQALYEALTVTLESYDRMADLVTYTRDRVAAALEPGEDDQPNA
jgi:hypothetical protein